jgi:uncharacterized protein YheU (UPF0270 family)
VVAVAAAAVVAVVAAGSTGRPPDLPGSEHGVEVPYTDLRADTLRNLVEEFVTRDGTDYGEVEKTLEQKVAALMRQLESGDAKISYESDSQSINIVARRELR